MKKNDFETKNILSEEKEISKNKELQLSLSKISLRKAKEKLFLHIFQDNWGIISFGVDMFIEKMQTLKDAMVKFIDTEAQNKTISNELIELERYLKEIQTLKEWLGKPELFGDAIKNQKQKFSTNKNEINYWGYEQGLTPEIVIRDFTLIRYFNDYKEQLSNSRIDHLIEKYNDQPFITPIKIFYKQVKPMREYLKMKEQEENGFNSKPGFYKFWAALFAPNTCGKKKLEVGNKILANIYNNQKYDHGLSDDEKITANDPKGRLYRDVVSKLSI